MQKAKIKLVIRNGKKNADGLVPICLRMRIDGERSIPSTGYYIYPHQWDANNERVKPSHPDADEINLDIAARKKEALQALIDAGMKKIKITSADIKVKREGFFSFAEQFIHSVENKREPGTISNYEKHLRKLEKFHGSKDLNFEDITPEFLTRFENYILKESNNRNENSNYAHAVLKTIRRVFSAAARKGITSPFKDYEMPEYTHGDKDHLTLKELDKWTDFYNQTEDLFLKEAALYFLFGCYSGLRISDWFLFDLTKQAHKDYIALRAKKNKEWIAIPMHKRLKFVLSEMKSLPLVSPEPNLNKRFKIVAKGAKINKHISSHCARKTFAVTMCLERKMPSETAAELMGITLNTFVNAYSKITPEKIRRDTAEAWKGL